MIVIVLVQEGNALDRLRNREGAFDIYGKDEDVELVGYTSVVVVQEEILNMPLRK